MPDHGGRTIVCVVGTRPEVIKMAPVVQALRTSDDAPCCVVATGQHGALLRPLYDYFGWAPDCELPAVAKDRSLATLMNRMTCGLAVVFEELQPALVLAAGDTCSVLAAALASWQLRIAFGHIEAGLRTHDLRAPYPEEANRVLATRLATLHFAPTPLAEQNLLDEGIMPEAIHVTGNPVIDALQEAAGSQSYSREPLERPSRLLVTVHRRENLGERLIGICQAIKRLSERHPELQIVWPLHPNPAVRQIVEAELGGTVRVKPGPALDYLQFVAALMQCDLVLTDSGGLQEEAPALGKPVLVLRESTERIEAVEAGAARLVGTSAARIEHEVTRLLSDDESYRNMSQPISPFGDGRAGRRIAGICQRYVAAGKNRGDQAA